MSPGNKTAFGTLIEPVRLEIPSKDVVNSSVIFVSVGCFFLLPSIHFKLFLIASCFSLCVGNCMTV